jgi:hypothetical protein
MQQGIDIVIIPYFYEAQHVSGETPTIIRSLKTALVASGFAYVQGCWTCGCWTLTAFLNVYFQQQFHSHNAKYGQPNYNNLQKLNANTLHFYKYNNIIYNKFARKMCNIKSYAYFSYV